MRTVLLAALSVGIGIGIGCIPVVRDHLHWNIWVVIPISGLLFGFGLAYLQFMSSYALSNHVDKQATLVFCVAAVLAYFGTEVGTYLAETVPVQGVEGMPGGEIKLSSLVSFPEYMSFRLGSSKLSTTKFGGGFEMGATGTSLSFLADLVGAALGAWTMFVILIPMYPYCASCMCYKQRHRLFKIKPEANEATVGRVLTSIDLACQQQDHQGLLQLLNSLEREHQDKGCDTRISADERFCPKCKEATVVGKVMRKQGNEWHDVADLAFSTTSEVGAHGTAVPTAEPQVG